MPAPNVPIATSRPYQQQQQQEQEQQQQQQQHACSPSSKGPNVPIQRAVPFQFQYDDLLTSGRQTFPSILYNVLQIAESKGISHIISWQPHGRSFRVHCPHQFIEHIMPKVFRQSKWASFQRQLNLYEFTRISNGPDKRSYYHFSFLRGRQKLAASITRTPVKGGIKLRTSNKRNPNLYSLPPVFDENDLVTTTTTAASKATFTNVLPAVQLQQVVSHQYRGGGATTMTDATRSECGHLRGKQKPDSAQQQLQQQNKSKDADKEKRDRSSVVLDECFNKQGYSWAENPKQNLSVSVTKKTGIKVDHDIKEYLRNIFPKATTREVTDDELGNNPGELNDRMGTIDESDVNDLDNLPQADVSWGYLLGSGM